MRLGPLLVSANGHDNAIVAVCCGLEPVIRWAWRGSFLEHSYSFSLSITLVDYLLYSYSLLGRSLTG